MMKTFHVYFVYNFQADFCLYFQAFADEALFAVLTRRLGDLLQLVSFIYQSLQLLLVTLRVVYLSWQYISRHMTHGR